MQSYRRDLKSVSRVLRKNMTEAEVRIWQRIRKKQISGVRFYRQKPLGRYVVDFYAPSLQLIVEIDGGQHFEQGDYITSDKERQKYLESLGCVVMRFTNIDVMSNTEGVVLKLCEYIEERV